MSHQFKHVCQKAISTFLTISVTIWSIGFPVGLLLYPQLAKAAPPAPTFGGPNEGQTGVPKDALVDRAFDQALEGSTVTTTNVLLQTNTGNTQSGAPTGSNLCTSVTLAADHNGNANREITCNHGDLADSTWYTFTITTGVKNSGGEALPQNFTVRFQTGTFTSGGFTGGATFAPPPQVVGTTPGSGGTFPANGKLIVTFAPGGLNPDTSTMATSGAGSVLDPANIQLFNEVNGAPSGAALTGGSLSWDGTTKRLTITPPALTVNNFYLLIIKNTVKNTDGNALPSDFPIRFQAVANDTAATSFVGMFPSDASTNVDRATYDITISFNEGLDAATVSSSTIQLIHDVNGNNTADDARLPIQVDLEPEGRVVHVAPLDLLPNATSTKQFIKVVSGASGIKDLAGNALGADIIKSFSVGTNINGAASDTTKPFILFAEANNFEVKVTFSEAMNVTDAATLNKFTLESPVGTNVSLSGKNIKYKAAFKTTFIRGLAIAPGQGFKLTVATSTKDLVGNNFDDSGTPAKNIFQGSVGNATQSGPTGGGGGGFEFGGGGGGHIDFFTLGTEPIMVMPDSQLAGATSQYRVEFKAANSIPSGGKIVLTYPSGFSFASACATKLDQFDNNDINGPSPNTVTFTPACDSNARTVTLTTSGGATNPNDFLHLKLQGIVNSTVPKDFTSTGYTVDIKTFDASSTLLDSKTSMPFFLATPGTQSISGTVFNDTNKNDTKDAGESGVSGVTVCLGGPMVGFNCSDTASDGTYSFGSLSNGFYNVGIPPITSTAVSVVGGSMFRDVNLTGGQSASNINFGLKAATETISVTVSGGPASEKVDVGAFNPYNTSQGGFTMRELTLDAAGAGSVNLPATIGKWQVNIMPWMPKTPGAPPSPPEFKFLPPPPREVNITTANQTVSVTFTLQTTNRTIKGRVADGTGAGIPNAYINARPAVATANVFGGGFAQSRADGTFELKVVNGDYIVESHMPGMPPPAPVQVTVKDNSSNTDGNTTADVFSGGALVTGAGITLKIAKADKSISGRVLDESGNAIAYAFVNGEKVDPSNPTIFLGHFVGAPTDSSGNFTLYVSAGTYKLRAFAPGFGDLGTKTVVVSDSSVSGQNFQASASDFGTVSGTVTVGGTAQSGAFVNIFGPSGGNGTVTGSDGTYSLKVKTGTGYVAEGFVPGKGPLAPTAAFTVTTSGVTGKDLSLAGTGTITVTITGVNDAFVDARDANGRGFGTGSAVSGVYTLTLPASATGIAYTVKAGTPQHGVIGSQSVTLTTDQTQAVSFTAGTLFTVSGTISSTAAACVSGVSLFLSDSDNGRHAGGSSSASGTYSIKVPNGTYNLVANKPGCVDDANPAKIVVSGADVSTGTNRTMAAADSTITGRVTLSGSNVTTPTFVFADNGLGKYVVDEVDISATGTSNNYTLNLTAGTWTVKARSDGSESSSVSVVVTSGGTVTQNLTLSAIAGYTVKEAKPFNVKPSQGGIVKNTDISSSFEVNIPAGVFGSSANDATVSTKEKTTVVDPPTDSIDVIGDKAVEVTPTDASGNKITTLSSSSGAGVTITIPYTEADLPSGTSETELSIGVWSEEKQIWEALPTTVDTTNNTLTGTTTHFSDFAPIAPVGGASAPSTPTGVTATSQGKTSMKVSWTQVSGATGYNVYRDTDSGGTFPRLGSDPTVSSGETTSYNTDQLTCNTTYYFKVSSTNASGESAASSAVSGTTDACTAGGGGGGGGGGGALSAPKEALQPKAEETTKPAEQVSTPQAPGVPGAAAVGFVEGALVRAANAFKVFIVKAGKLLHIPNPTAFAALGLQWGSVKEVPSSDVATAPEITLQRGAGDFKVYTVRDGRKLHIPSPEAFTNAGHKWEDIVEVQKGFIENTPDASLIRPSDSPKVYTVEKGQLRWVTTLAVFNRMKLNWADVAVVGSKELYYPIGKDIK